MFFRFPHVSRCFAISLAAFTLSYTSGCSKGVGNDSAGAEFKDAKAYTLNAEGDLVRPTGYRSWIYVGTPVTPNDMNNGKAAFPEHHNVYIDPASYEHYVKTGKWREGTILVKELVSVGTKAAVSGNGYFQGEFIGLEATIKSAKDFPDEPGNWAYFSFTNEEELGGDLKSIAKAFPAASCNACHAASAKDDFVFTQHYPVLRAAKGAKNMPEDESQRPKTLGMMQKPDTITFEQSQREETWRATAATPAKVAGTEVPTAEDALFEYLQSKQYQKWQAQEKTAHPSRGPHTQFGKPVRTYMNATLAKSMKAKSSSHPVGSTAIKEMFDDNNKLIGWAVETKTQKDSDKGAGWFWYEVVSTTDRSNPVAIGNGVMGCASCHAKGGSDYVLTPLPK